MIVSVYCLKRPDTDEVFYVGQTTLDLPKRLNQHFYQKNPAQKYIYIQDLLSRNIYPAIELLEKSETETARQCERKWIAHYLATGINLLNGNALPEHPLIDWLKAHDLLSLNRLEQITGMPQNSLHKAIKGVRPLPEKYVKPLVKELKKYGYQ